MTSTLPTVLLIPTGIGCAQGGFAGDALPSARLLAAASGCLITHPNVMNGASLYWNDSRIQYLEGYGLDRFLVGSLALRSVRQQKVGLLLDAGIEANLRERHLHVAEGCRATLGLNIGPILTTEAPLEISLDQGSSGISWGGLSQVDVLLRAGEKLKQAGATAIAVVTRLPDSFSNMSLEKYRKGEGVDAISGAEAVISHLLVRHLWLPCAHAPAMSALPVAPELDPRAAAEEIGHTFLPSVLVGLSRAPDLISLEKDILSQDFQNSQMIYSEQLGAVVVPQGALGGEGVLAAIERKIPLIVVSNPNLLNVSTETLGLRDDKLLNERISVMYAMNYVEAAGLILLLREGISKDSLYRPIAHIHEV